VASLLEVGTGFHPELTGRENVYLNGAILGMSKVEIARKFDEIVAFADVERFLDTPVKRYSSGMYMRLAFAVAAHLEPEILIVDEVLAVGDADFQKKSLGKMKDVASSGRTVLFVSHNLAVIRNVCRTACWLEKGRVKMWGESMAVTDQYLRSGAGSKERKVDVSLMKRGGHFGEKLRIERVEWLTELPFSHDGRMGVEIGFRALTDVEELTMGIGFSALDGTRLLTYETDLYGARPGVKSGHRGCARVEIDNLPLPPGYYSVDVGARSGELHGVDYLAGFAQVEVVPGLRTPGNLSTAGAGVRIPSTWEWVKDK
jgi:lipopolysaccharide transport system ATP-binding protein